MDASREKTMASSGEWKDSGREFFQSENAVLSAGNEHASSRADVDQEQAPAPPAAKKSRKRKADDSADSQEPATKTPRRIAPNTKRAKAANAAKTQMIYRDSEDEQARNKISTTPLAPKLITQAVTNKIMQVRKLLERNDQSKLYRDPNNKNVIFVPYLNLLGTITLMYVHYEMGRQEEASMADVANLIVSRFKKCIGHTANVPWVAIDISNECKFELSIHEKIAGHGLDHVNLLEMELELRMATELKSEWKREPDMKWDADRFQRDFDKIWKKVLDSDTKRKAAAADTNTERTTKSTRGDDTEVAPTQEEVDDGTNVPFSLSGFRQSD